MTATRCKLSRDRKGADVRGTFGTRSVTDLNRAARVSKRMPQFQRRLITRIRIVPDTASTANRIAA